MTTIANQMRALALQVEALASSGGGAGNWSSWPTGTNLIGGTEPTAPTLVSGDVDHGSVNLVQYDRLCAAMPDGGVMLFGDSLVQPMPPGLVSPFGTSLGYGGASTRRMIHHMKRPAYKAALQRAGAGVILTGPNDIGNIGYYGTWQDAAGTVVGMFANQIKNWITGRWVIVKPLPGDERISGIPSYYNEAMASIGSGIDTTFAGVSNIAIVDAWSVLTDSSGNLATANHIGDGQHISKAGYAILCPLIAAALDGLGVQ